MHGRGTWSAIDLKKKDTSGLKPSNNFTMHNFLFPPLTWLYNNFFTVDRYTYCYILPVGVSSSKKTTDNMKEEEQVKILETVIRDSDLCFQFDQA